MPGIRLDSHALPTLVPKPHCTLAAGLTWESLFSLTCSWHRIPIYNSFSTKFKDETKICRRAHTGNPDRKRRGGKVPRLFNKKARTQVQEELTGTASLKGLHLISSLSAREARGASKRDRTFWSVSLSLLLTTGSSLGCFHWHLDACTPLMLFPTR